MSKFEPLSKYLEACGKEVTTLSFSDIEHIISEKLYPSARKYSAYWRLSERHMLPKTVDSAGYMIENVSLSEERVTLKRKT